MDKRKIEQFTASLAVLLLFIMSIGVIIFFGDQFFNWDIFPPHIEKILGFIMASTVVLIISSVLVNLMLNIGIIAMNSDELTQVIKESNES